jgi:hypothetical protein
MIPLNLMQLVTSVFLCSLTMITSQHSFGILLQAVQMLNKLWGRLVGLDLAPYDLGRQRDGNGYQYNKSLKRIE